MSVLRNMMIADRIVSLGLLAAGLSHHIRNSMVAVKTFLELAPIKMAEERDSSNAGLRDPDFWREYHSNVQGQIEKVNVLLADLRTAAEAGKSSDPFADEIQLKSALDLRLEALAGAFAARRINCENQVAADLPAMRVDKPKFDRLIDLLLKDELAMLPAGSKITLTAENIGPDMIIRLVDNGPALPPAALQVVCDPFTVTSGVPSEYGINLMACFFIAHHHGGKVEAHSQPGGNTFTVRLPLKPERVQEASGEEATLLKRTLLNDNLWTQLLAKA
jgi:signal transduction histidine kinase